jgi:hypothetical protein
MTGRPGTGTRRARDKIETFASGALDRVSTGLHPVVEGAGDVVVGAVAGTDLVHPPPEGRGLAVRSDGHVAPPQQVTDDAAFVGVDGEFVGRPEFGRPGPVVVTHEAGATGLGPAFRSGRLHRDPLLVDDVGGLVLRDGRM